MASPSSRFLHSRQFGSENLHSSTPHGDNDDWRGYSKQPSSSAHSFRLKVASTVSEILDQLVVEKAVKLPFESFLECVNFPIPTYDGEDDLSTFTSWLLQLESWLRIYQLVGECHDAARIQILHQALTGNVAKWYMTCVTGPAGDDFVARRGYENTFQGHILLLASEFISQASLTKAWAEFDNVQYNQAQGVRAFHRNLDLAVRHILLGNDFAPTELAIRDRIMTEVPERFRRFLSRSASTEEWVDEIERLECCELQITLREIRRRRMGLATPK
ncbi:hypothetical protein DL93DRAFT_1750844 [Clavulina sp. PMI_390]|nr:hypothetical protein DL93DRAFT_1750844 [Clavulina sp. PMI_390]